MTNPRLDAAYRSRMLGPLLAKEFRQLRVLRWVAFLSGPLLCTLLILLVDAGNRGTTGFAMLAGYDDRTLLTELMPAVLGALWVFLAMVLAVHAFSAPDGATLEPFLLERPVRRSTVWWARLWDALASALLTAGLHFGFWALYAMSRIGLPTTTEGGWHRVFAAGAIGILAGVCVGAWAGAVSDETPRGILIGILLLITPVGIALGLGNQFPFVVLWNGPFFLWAAWLFWLLLARGSYRAACVGEPAGRGRLARAIRPAIAGLVIAPLVFVLSAAPLVRHGAAAFGQSSSQSSAHESGFLIRNHAAWWVDLDGKSVRRFFPPPVHWTGLNDDGNRLAVLHSSGRFGRALAHSMLDLYDESGALLRRTRFVDDDARQPGNQHQAAWLGERIYFVIWRNGAYRGFWLNPETGQREDLDLSALSSYRVRLLKPSGESAQLFLLDGRPDETSVVYRLGAHAQGGPLEIVAEGHVAYGPKISPRGTRVAMIDRRAETQSLCLQDIDTPSKRSCHPGNWIRLWLDENRVLTRTPDRLLMIEFDLETGSSASRWFDGESLGLSPNGDRLLHHSLRGEIFVSTIEGGRFETQDLVTAGLEEIEDPHGLGWAGPRHLYVHGLDGVHLLDLNDPGLRWKRIAANLPRPSG